MIHLVHELSRIDDCGIVFAHKNVVPFILDCHLHARNVAHAAPSGTARIMNGRKALRMKTDFEKLQFKMCATICARIQIDEQDIGYIMKIAEHLLFYDVFINKKYIFYIFYLLFLSLFPSSLI
jgi:hypothetical protein